MKKLISTIGIIVALLTSATIICTLLTTYQFIYVGQIFNSYKPIQIMISITMIVWCLKYVVNRKSRKDLIYAGIFFLFACISLYFLSIVQ